MHQQVLAGDFIIAAESMLSSARIRPVVRPSWDTELTVLEYELLRVKRKSVVIVVVFVVARAVHYARDQNVCLKTLCSIC